MPATVRTRANKPRIVNGNKLDDHKMTNPPVLNPPVGGFNSYSEQFDKGDCPNARVPYMLGVSSAEKRAMVFRPRCKVWSCPVCGPANAWVWAFRANSGAHALYDRGKPLDFIAITSHEKLTPAQSFWVAPKAWMKLQMRIRRETGGFEYFCVPEVQKNGRVHFHLVTTAALSKKWWKTNARECGFGFQSDRKEVYDLGGVIGYMSKYLTKTLHVADLPKGTRRVRTSRGWPKAPQRDPPEGWEFAVIKQKAQLAEVLVFMKQRGYEVAMKGSKSAWDFIENAE